MLCFIFGHKSKSGMAESNEAHCQRCGKLLTFGVEPTEPWPRLTRECPPMPPVKPPRIDGVRVENVTLSPKAFALAQLENEKESLDRMILSTSRKIEAHKQHMRELYQRRELTQNSMIQLINTRD